MSRSAAGALRGVVLVAVLAAAQVAVESRSFAAPLGPSSLKIVSFTSSLLSQFWGAPTQMEAGVFVPASCRGAATPCPVMYHLPGYGGSIDTAWGTVAGFAHLSARDRRFAMAHVFLDPSVNGGFSYFTDSENNGPWNSALTQELIPYIEAQFGVGGSPASRFLQGHSSGGWTVAWLQVSNPDFFRAVWAISPDPLDFRHFYQIDAAPGSTDNFYSKPNGALRFLTRSRDITMERLMQHVDDDPTQGGIISSYEFAWSPRGDDGLPLRFFNRADGSLEESTLEAWQAYDVHTVLSAGGDQLKQALAGKINIYCGTLDDFHYNEPTAAICQFLRENHYDAVCRLVPGRTHGTVFASSSLYPAGLIHLIVDRASKIWREEQRAAVSTASHRR